MEGNRLPCRKRRNGVARGRRVVGLTKEVIMSAVILALLALAWEAGARSGLIPRFLLASPSEAMLYMMSHPRVVMSNFATTAWEVLLGLAAGASAGVLLGILIFYSAPIRKMMYPLLVASQVVPKVAVAPFLLLWFGYGLVPKVVITALMSFFPLVLNTLLGLTSVEPDMVDLGRSLHAPALRMLSKIYLISALPHMFAGLKTASTLSVIGAVVAEFTGSQAGLGYLILMGLSYGETPMMAAALVLLFVLGVVLFVAVDLSERTAIQWYYLERENR